MLVCIDIDAVVLLISNHRCPLFAVLCVIISFFVSVFIICMQLPAMKDVLSVRTLWKQLVTARHNWSL